MYDTLKTFFQIVAKSNYRTMSGNSYYVIIANVLVEFGKPIQDEISKSSLLK